MKKKKNIIISVCIVLLIIILAVILSLILKPRRAVFNKDFKTAGSYSEPLKIGENRVFTEYQDYIKIFEKGDLTPEDFKEHNYVTIKVQYDSCADKNITPTDYKIKDNTIYVNISYEQNCGVCAPYYMYYLLKVDKDVTNPMVDINYKAVKYEKCDPNVSYKPMIYIYPEEKTNVSVKVGYPELLTTTYPKYEDKWEVTAYPDGTLVDNNGRSYYGLYWEGKNSITNPFKDGFVVEKDSLIPFFEEKLSVLGLTEKEANEFIVYWLPKLEKNEYNLIRFEEQKVINEQMPLEINPKPDTLIRVLMEYKPADKDTTIKEQKLERNKRSGYSVIEWGGTEIK